MDARSRATIGTAGRWIAGKALDILLPPACMACDAPVAASFQLCGACFARCHFITAPLCASCGVPFTYAGQRGPGGACPACVADPPRFATARAAITYDEHAKPLILRFKYANGTELARLFAPMLLRAGQAMLHQADVLVPVPLHPARLRERGYNQSALLCRALSRLVHVPIALDALQRTRRTPKLGEHDAATRATIMHSAVRLRPGRESRIQGARVVLIDDVMTSGATAGACANTLRAAGAERVDVLVVARVPNPTLR